MPTTYANGWTKIIKATSLRNKPPCKNGIESPGMPVPGFSFYMFHGVISFLPNCIIAYDKSFFNMLLSFNISLAKVSI